MKHSTLQTQILNPILQMPHPISYTLHPPHTLHPTPYTLHPTPYTYTVHSTLGFLVTRRSRFSGE